MDEIDRRILDFEKRWWKYAGNKEAAIRDELGMSAVRYSQRLNRIIDTTEALEFDPVLVNRLRRVRQRRTTERDQRKGLM